jgi:1,4-alpha-glucan branching enzyme
MVSRPTSIGGLGFGMKWMMGWMRYFRIFSKDTTYRKYHQNDLTFLVNLRFSEEFCCHFLMMKLVYGKKIYSWQNAW